MNIFSTLYLKWLLFHFNQLPPPQRRQSTITTTTKPSTTTTKPSITTTARTNIVNLSKTQSSLPSPGASQAPTTVHLMTLNSSFTPSTNNNLVSLAISSAYVISSFNPKLLLPVNKTSFGQQQQQQLQQLQQQQQQLIRNTVTIR